MSSNDNKCDGDHASPICADLECWRRDNMTSNDYQAIVDLCERNDWHWSIQVWGEGAQLQLQTESYAGPVVAEINGRSIADLRRRVDNEHAAATATATANIAGRVPASAMQPGRKSGPNVIDLARSIMESIEADQ